ncbi:uncharacterized protein isoform X2 [Musca autumnalis]|uniref:uncharacterized protein isoform X2 n=1 Tax=Musca autumnalis TaxID=221902 RepID=UPI003CF0CB71
MLSYVIPAHQEANSHRTEGGDDAENGDGSITNREQVPSPPRTTLSLRLNSQYMAGAESHKTEVTEVDALLANVSSGHDFCDDERTHLLNDTNHTPVRVKRNGSNNNNSFNLNNNSSNTSSNCDDVVNVNNVNVCSSIEGTSSDAAPHTHHTADANGTHNPTAQKDDSQNPRQQSMTTKKPKLSKLGSNKTVGLKRVSFGSSKGSMVETLVFETPTPLSEHVEPSFGFGSEGDYKANMDDSGIEVQEESERSIVRVSIYQSSKPQQICPPDYFSKFEDNLDNSLSNYNCNLDDIMTSASPIPGYDRQQSTDSGWDNPFRPGGDLSREADEIVKMISGGKPITPTEDNVIGNGKSQSNGTSNGTVVTEDITKSNVSQNQSAQNGTNGSHRVQPAATAAAGGGAVKPSENNGVTSLAQVSKQVVPGPTSASHVVIDEKKNKKKGCCIIQ